VIVDTFSDKPKTVTIELPVLRMGAKGAVVFTLQQLLVANGYNIVLDGSFGAKTLNALECYQEDNDLKSDGSCGKATWNKLLGVN
jgi:peptidoglycan hydrolase-like protein with peptidoglycan-binding domain